MSFISSPLDDCLGSQAKVRLLRFFSSTREPVTGREAGRRVGMSKRPIDLALRDLVAVGVVRRKDIGNHSLYQLNPHNALARHAVFKLFKGERETVQEFFDTLRDLVEVGVGSPPLWAGLFGSTAQGTDRTDSDVDLAVVVATDALTESMRSRLSESAPMFRRRFGRPLSPVVVSAEQLRRLHRAQSPLALGLRTARQVGGTVSDVKELLDDSH